MQQDIKATTTLLPCAGLIYIENKKLLLAYSNKKQCFYLPGGKIDAGEKAMQALCREVFEEMNVQVAATDLKFYTHIILSHKIGLFPISRTVNCSTHEFKINQLTSQEKIVIKCMP